MAQSILVYAEPIMSMAENATAFNEAIQIASQLWNYALGVEKGNADKKIESAILSDITKAFKLDAQKARELLEKMVARRSDLFPPDIQPEIPLVMFVRKETPTIIDPFDYSQITLTTTIIPPDEEDKSLIADFKKLETEIEVESQYQKYEKLFFALKDKCRDRFAKWLGDKGLKEEKNASLACCIDIYLDFVYFYMHDTPVTLSSIDSGYLQEFLEDYLLRKLLVPAQEYVNWPASMKLFYQFLSEKGYLGNAERIIKRIESLEGNFLKLLRKQFG
jgi:hypothetical protein